MKSLPPYTSYFLSMLLNDVIVDIEKRDGYVHLLLLQKSCQDYFYILQSFLLYIQDLDK